MPGKYFRTLSPCNSQFAIRNSQLLLVCVLVLAVVAGCDKPLWPASKQAPKAAPPPAVQAPVTPEEVKGTIAQYAVLNGGGYQPVEGYGIVFGLGTNGSSEVPPQIEKYLVDDMQKRGLASKIRGTADLSPTKILRSLDTAVVVVRGSIPPGAPADARFDLTVTAWPGTQTRSLYGGLLMPTEMRQSLNGAFNFSTGSPVLAAGASTIFTNPYLDPKKPEDAVKFRNGRVIGGGRVVVARPMSLQLIQPDHARCQRITRRINERFPGKDDVARGRGSQMIDLRVPPEYRDDYDHFTELVMHLPLVSGGAEFDQIAVRVGKMMETPTQRQEDLALVWEAMGRQVLAQVRPSYTSSNPRVAFFAARTGVRLADDAAADIVIRIAASAGAPLQVAAIQELGRHKKIFRAAQVLRDLLDDDNQSVRIEAYEALRKRGDPSIISLRVDADADSRTCAFEMDLVPAKRNHAIYATQAVAPRIAMFGKNMQVKHPMFFNSPDDMLTINAGAKDNKVAIYRTVPRSGRASETLYSDFEAASLIAVMGSPAQAGDDGKIQGLSLTYGQVVDTLRRMCEGGCLDAKFVLQPQPDVQKIYENAPGVGRPDMAAPDASPSGGSRSTDGGANR